MRESGEAFKARFPDNVRLLAGIRPRPGFPPGRAKRDGAPALGYSDPFFPGASTMHAKPLTVAFLVLCSLGAPACGGGSATTDEPGGGSAEGGGGSGAGAGAAGGAGGATGTGTPTATQPTGEALTLDLEPFDVPSGTERQVCKTINLPLDVPFDVVQLRSKMLGTSHHFTAYKVLTDPTKPVTEAESKVHDCAPASEQLSGDAAYFFGSATPERVVDLPAGVAFHFLPGQRIILEQHVINATADVIQGGVTFELAPAVDPSKIEHHGDVIWFANWSFFLGPNQESQATKHCTVPYAVELFGLTSHTHALGTHFSIEKWSAGQTEHIYDSVDWSHPPYDQHDPPLSLAAGEGLQWTCTWQNPTSSAVIPGKDSTDEMCMTFAYAYPKDTLAGDPIQCN